MTISLGLDVGSNSVGSAWVDSESRSILAAVSVFPAGVETSTTKRGAPKGQTRRQKRSSRRNLKRRAQRKRLLREALFADGLLPSADAAGDAFQALMEKDPWVLRRDALSRPLEPHEFGRALVHLDQRRGWDPRSASKTDDDADHGKVKKGMDTLRAKMAETNAETFGQFMADLQQQRTETTHRSPIRNRRGSFEFHADRQLIQREFDKIWEGQAAFDSPLAKLLTKDLRERLQSIIFFQRPTYWNVSTLGRCNLEPTDRKCPKADMHAQRFLMLETVNRIRVEEPDSAPRELTIEERAALIKQLSTQETVKIASVRKALRINKKKDVKLNIEREEKPALNTDWFSAAIIHGVFGQSQWDALPDRIKESVNRAVQKFTDPEKLRRGAAEWWGLGEEATDKLLAALKTRPKDTVNLSRRAIRKLLPYMEQGADVSTAKQKCGYPPHGYRANKAARRFLAKHPGQLPPAPELPNPVVRKAIHEVRRHVHAYLRRFGRKPDRIVVELAREATQSAVVRDARLEENRKREAERIEIEKLLAELGIERSRWPKAVERVRLCRRQKGLCAYTGQEIQEKEAALGDGVEVDHIVPWSRSADDSLNNKVLCRTASNRNKGNLTPKEWLSPDEFEALEKRLAHYEKNYKRAWDNLRRDAPDMDAFVSSQLTDTAYIASAVCAYLREALYPTQPDRVLCTKGIYTAILRRDWGLLVKGEKNRDDHRHHAVDAVAIALTDRYRLEKLAQRAQRAQEQKTARAGQGNRPKWAPLAEPWDGFRDQVMCQLLPNIIVAHRPQRGIYGALHEDTPLGAVRKDEGLFVVRIPARKLKAKMLRKPERKARGNGRVTWEIGRGGVVRDPALRNHILACLREHGLDFDPEEDDASKFDASIAEIVKEGKLRMPSGVPIRRIRLLRKVTRPIAIESDPEHPRYYIGGNNHHMEIAEDLATGRWFGRTVSMFEAARRIHPPRGTPALPLILGPKAEQLRSEGRLPPADNSFYRGRRFVMSLCAGETLLMKDPDTGRASYFVVAKISPGLLELVEHADARPSTSVAGAPPRRLLRKTPAELQLLEPEPGVPPHKVRVDLFDASERDDS